MNNTQTIEILGTTGQLTATDGEEVAITVEDNDPAIINGIAYAFRSYFVRNEHTGNWRAKAGFYIDRLVLDEDTGTYSRDWYKAPTSNAQSAIYRAAIEAAEAIDQGQLDAGLIYRLAQKVTSAKEAAMRADLAYDASKNLLAEAEAQLAAGVLS